MPSILSGWYDASFVATVFAGGVVILPIAERQIDGTYLDLTGRVFKQRVFAADGGVVAEADGVVGLNGEDTPQVVFTIGADTTAELLPAGAEARDYQHTVVEITGAGEVDRIPPRPFRVRLTGARD